MKIGEISPQVMITFMIVCSVTLAGVTYYFSSGMDSNAVEELERKPDMAVFENAYNNISNGLDFISACFDACNYSMLPSLRVSIEENITVCYRTADLYENWYMDSYFDNMNSVDSGSFFRYTNRVDSVDRNYQDYISRYNRMIELGLIK